MEKTAQTRGGDPIDGGKYELSEFGVHILVRDGQCDPGLLRSMSNEVLLVFLKGLDDYMSEEKGGYYTTIINIEGPDMDGLLNVVGHAYIRPSIRDVGVEGVDVCLPLSITDLTMP